MISPDYFSFRWSWYRPILNRQEQPADRCAVEVRRLPIRVSGEDAREYIPYAVQTDVKRAIATSLRRLQDYSVRYVVRGEKVSAHTLPHMDERVRRMVAYLRKQNPHLSRDLLHHWCADPKGATALLNVCEVLWQQGWQQDQADAAPWVPAVNVLLLKLIRNGIAELSDAYADQTSHVMLCVIGGLYVWALQHFLKHYLEGVVEVTRIATYESMMLPATPMAFLQYQPDASLLGDDSRIIRAYGLEPEIVPRMRQLRAKVGMHNEGGILQLLARDKLGNHLQRRTWARLSLWKLAMDSGFGGWMRYVLNAKRLDQLLAGQTGPDAAEMENLKANHTVPVATWLLASMAGDKALKAVGEPWLQDNITLMAFRVFDEDIKVEVARRRSETSWLDRTQLLDERKSGGSKAATVAGGRSASLRSASGLRSAGGLRNAASHAGIGEDSDIALEKAWKDGELVLIQPDLTKALHSGRALSQRQACLNIEWSEYLARLHTLHGDQSGAFMRKTFLPGVLSLLDGREHLFLDICSATGCLLRGSVVSLAETGVALRHQLRQWLIDALGQHHAALDKVGMPAISMCMDLSGEWTFAELNYPKLGNYRIAFSLAVPQVDAGVCRDHNVERLICARNAKKNVESLGGINVEPVKTVEGRTVQMLHNCGFALTASALTELTSALASKASIANLRPNKSEMQGVLDDYQLPPGGLDLLVIQRFGHEGEQPWLLIKAGKPNLAGVDVDMFELLDADAPATACIIERGLMRWG
ncbi:MAG: hypothetical protein Q9M82_03160 [Mariprofundus sp.]|nr:hypothetical protein [Mariprofundus sp.]